MKTDWESRYRSGDTPWCKGRAHPMLSGIIDRLLPVDFNGRIVVPGCGRGWDLANLAEARPAATIIGVDISETALSDLANNLPAGAKVELLVGDFLDASWCARHIAAADFIWEHTCFCAIDPARRADYAASAASVLKPAATLAGVFFLHLDDGGDGPPWNCEKAELEAHFRGTFEPPEYHPADITFDGREGEEECVVLRRSS